MSKRPVDAIDEGKRAHARLAFSPADEDAVDDDAWYAIFAQLHGYTANALASTCRRLTRLRRTACRALYIGRRTMPSWWVEPFIAFSDRIDRVSFDVNTSWPMIERGWTGLVKQPDAVACVIQAATRDERQLIKFTGTRPKNAKLRVPVLCIITELWTTHLCRAAIERILVRVAGVRRLAVQVRIVERLGRMTALERLVVYRGPIRFVDCPDKRWHEFTAPPPVVPDVYDPVGVAARYAFERHPHLRHFVWVWISQEDEPWNRICQTLLAPLP